MQRCIYLELVSLDVFLISPQCPTHPSTSVRLMPWPPQEGRSGCRDGNIIQTNGGKIRQEPDRRIKSLSLLSVNMF